MKKIVVLFGCLFLAFNGMAQTKAITESGDEVTLYADGTWKYIKEPEESVISTSPKTFTKTAAATFLVKSVKYPEVGFWINPKKWKFEKGGSNEDAEYSMQHKEKDIYAMVIAESIEIPLENLRNIAVKNAKDAAPDVTVVKEEYRMVNGIKVMCLQMNGTVQGIKVTYLGYYYSSSKGTLQFLSFTAQNMFASLAAECEELLNGLVSLKQ